TVSYSNVLMYHLVINHRCGRPEALAMLEQRDKSAHLRHLLLVAVRVLGRAPFASRMREPLRILLRPGRGHEREELAPQRVGPLPEHMLDAVAGQPRDENRGGRQPTPRCRRRIVGERAGEAERTVLAAVPGIAVFGKHLEIAARKLLRR